MIILQDNNTYKSLNLTDFMEGLKVFDAAKLIVSLEKHPLLAALNKEAATKVIGLLKFDESSRFYITIPENSQEITESSDRYHYFLLRRVLRNDRARGYNFAFLKQMHAGLLSSFRAYSSDVIARRIRDDDGVVDIMYRSARSGNPYSLLGKLETFEADGEDSMSVTTRPILIVPETSARESARLQEWEAANSLHEKESRVLGFFPYRREVKAI